MPVLKNRDFTINGVEFHLNDNPWHNEFEGKYRLLYWNTGLEKSINIGTFNTKKRAIEFAKEYEKCLHA